MSTSNHNVKKYLDNVIAEIKEHFNKSKLNIDIFNPNIKLLIAPAILIDIAGMKAGEDDGTDRNCLNLEMSAFCVFKRGLVSNRFLYLVKEVAADLMGFIRDNNFNCSGWVELPNNMEANTIDFEVSGLFECIEVEWTQTIYLGESVWDSDGIIPEEVMISFVPEIGEAHKEGYECV
ncbi:hypothetical protein AAEX28_12500 [Lentisphaerota bacterium WC36G]|nr:hypothetical protein LJT99_15325 [Lentisphaerae bacterium WC36]